MQPASSAVCLFDLALVLCFDAPYDPITLSPTILPEWESWESFQVSDGWDLDLIAAGLG